MSSFFFVSRMATGREYVGVIGRDAMGWKWRTDSSDGGTRVRTTGSLRVLSATLVSLSSSSSTTFVVSSFSSASSLAGFVS